jgi:hypothetical protein
MAGGRSQHPRQGESFTIAAILTILLRRVGGIGSPVDHPDDPRGNVRERAR